jgi:phage/plasmid-like protein (TIGR03299 family)
MSHEVETMAYAGETPWHGLGVSVHNDLTPKQMLVKAGLDWKVELEPQYIKRGEGRNRKEIESGQLALVRDSDDKILTYVTEEWKPNQNEVAAEFFKDFVLAGDMEMHTAGSLREGQMVWFLAKVNKSFTLKRGRKEDLVESYLLFSNPHMYGKSIDIRFTPIRVVCNNTLTLALKGGKSDMVVKIDHRRKFDPNLVKTTLGLADTRMTEYKEMAEFLVSRKAKKEKVLEYFRAVFPATEGSALAKDPDYLSKPAQKMMELMDTQPGADFAAGSWWQPFNAVTYGVDHVLGHAQETRLQSAWYGTNRLRKVNALHAAVVMARES